MAEPVQVAFRVFGTDWGLTRGHGSRQIDWLVDGTILNKNNVVFVIDQPISRKYKQALQAKYRVYDASSVWSHFSSTNTHRWHKFLLHYKPKHFVAYNDFHPRHRERNAILRAAGVETWHYSHSVHTPNVYRSFRYQHWEEMDYDHQVFWGDMDANAFCPMTNLPLVHEHKLGPLFSGNVPRTVVAVFDSSWEHYPHSTEGEFFWGIVKLLNTYRDMVMLYKPKHVDNHRRYFAHPRFYALPPWINPALVIGCASLTISLAFTSPTIEALGAGKKAFWYDPLAQFRDNFYKDIPYLVAHGYDELEKLFRHWHDGWINLDGLGQPYDWRAKYLDKLFGGRCDDQGANKFRELLVK